MSVFPDNIRFHGQWRPYQQRVLNHLDGCLNDRKVHIVAAPGSGKTTVGLEILVRIGCPALILAPSITIREQWIERFSKSFLPEGEKSEGWISNSIRSPKALTVITYQALHSAYNRLSESEKEEDVPAGESETAGYAGFDLIGTLKAAEIGTVCMDEAHHLRSEWWKALEKVVAELGKNTVTVSLTATPPYDSKLAEWQRYIDLCGEIDEEIFTPELVKENNLCPHQDYVYFNWPEEDEIRTIRAFRESARSVAGEIAESPPFIEAIRRHPGISDVESYAELFLDRPNYLTSLMVFLHHHHIEFPKALRDLIGTSAKLPDLDLNWTEVLLQGFLYDDSASYPDCSAYQEELRKKLSGLGHISRKTVLLTGSDEINRLLVNSRGKLTSIVQIVRAEHKSLGGGLRLLVLTDFIRKETLPLIGRESGEIQRIGVLPIFEALRRAGIPGLKLGVLSGSVVIVPRDGMDALRAAAVEKGVQIDCRPLPCPDYVEANFSSSDAKQKVAVITDFFTAGGIHALIGTKSLLGEGWDSPCINTLILASFVGSYMLSNQMRGRAIRVYPPVPDKTANIWHLVSMEPVWAYSDSMPERLLARAGNGGADSQTPISEDFMTLRRRFRAFLGVGDSEDVIEDGIDRLSVIRPPYDRRHIEQINRQMLETASDRKQLIGKWRRAIARCPDASQVIELSTMDQALVPHRFVFRNAVASFGGTLLAEALLSSLLRSYTQLGDMGGRSTGGLLILWTLIAVFASLAVKYAVRIYRSISPQACLKQMGTAVLKALKSAGTVESYNTRVVAENCGEFATACYLEGGTTYEKSIFTEGISQLLDFIDNPRYLLVQREKFLWFTHTEYFAVPEVLGNRKENAEELLRWMQRLAGHYRLVYTRTPDGRKTLLKARAKSFVNHNNRLLDRTHKLKTEWE